MLLLYPRCFLSKNISTYAGFTDIFMEVQFKGRFLLCFSFMLRHLTTEAGPALEVGGVAEKDFLLDELSREFFLDLPPPPKGTTITHHHHHHSLTEDVWTNL